MTCGTRVSPLIMHAGVHCTWIVIITPPSDRAKRHVLGAGVPRNGPTAVGIIKTVVARLSAGGQQRLAVLPDISLDLSAGHRERIGWRSSPNKRVHDTRAYDSKHQRDCQIFHEVVVPTYAIKEAPAYWAGALSLGGGNAQGGQTIDRTF
jgi:hypothetical protein